jgi:hypothetical protein
LVLCFMVCLIAGYVLLDQIVKHGAAAD